MAIKKRERIVGSCSVKDMEEFLSSTSSSLDIVDRELMRLKRQIENL